MGGEAAGQETNAAFGGAAFAQEADVVDEARRAQANFENRRIRLLPDSIGGFGGPCDAVVGRICVGSGGGEW